LVPPRATEIARDADPHLPREPVRLRKHLSGLSEQATLVAIDLPGFGGSERRDELFKTQTMGAFLMRLMD
jgi:pimeloyl-ACP methyl ester carboxylesterase